MDKTAAERLLEEAVSANDSQKLEEIISGLERRNFPPDKLKELLNSQLYQAMSHSSQDIVRFLVKKGADINHHNSIKQSILFRAIHSTTAESENILKFLLENGADINHKNINGQTDFMDLMVSDKLTYSYLLDIVDAVSNIQERDLRTGGSYLHIVSNRWDDESRVDMLNKLLKMGLDINCLDNNDDTPLHLMGGIACCYSIKFLLENGADIKARNRMGETVLHYLACSNEFDGFSDSLKLLIDKGADINELDYEGRTSVHQALTSKDTTCESIKELMKYGIKMNVQDYSGRNEIFFAVHDVKSYLKYTEEADLERRSEVIKLLAEEGVDVNTGDMHGITPLHMSTTLGSDELDILVTLLDLGADFTRKTNTGATALHWACKTYNMAHVLTFFYLENGKDINVKDDYGSTILHWAVWHRKLSVCRSVLQAGADANIKDTTGKTPGDLARILHFDDFHKLLSTYKTLEPLEIQYPVVVCNGSDPIFSCPILKYIKKLDHKIDVQEYMKHVDLHKASLSRSVSIMLGLSNMGMFYDIEENTTVPEKIDTLMCSIVNKVAGRNPLFCCELRLAGSSFEGTKVQVRDEFDYIWSLTEFNESFVPVESSVFPEGFVKLHIKEEMIGGRFSQYLDKDNFLDSRFLTRQLFSLINEEVKNTLKGHNDLVCIKFLDEIFCGTSNLVFHYFGRQAKSFTISVDVVPTILLAGWTPVGFHVRHSLLLQHSTNDLIFSAILKTPDRVHVEHYTMFFRVSYGYIEQGILQSVPYDVKKGYIILKSLAETGYFPKVVDHDNDRTIKKFITSYHLKTCFLHELEKARNEGDLDLQDTPETPVNRISLNWAKRILDRLESCIHNGSLPSFFNPSKNLLGVSLEGMCHQENIIEKDALMQLVSLFQYLLNTADI
ncbi:serine/threonine-protein phosphatase 6 regulatory ankyrin repeat subunit C-like [Anneissia japonica]|uniref:serine/threonine-protein phosphatase 6 regulatory ankyrin repeat subunit C-like n=1 Tax=Anneissia japonica TaxID=1529436 RepID=UPI0014259446|nr:serine/threonine-protein phosphatase 6 regulatory ankyrin repeat subunit C-like [Anneissia japonica]